MKRTLYVVTLLVAAVCMAEEKAATPKEGQRTHSGTHVMPKEILEKYDKDGDGKLNEAEMKAFREARQAEMIKKYDKDGDGKLNDEEKKAAREDFMKRHEAAKGDKAKEEKKDK
jgi:Ca2+-binding EF-hand superfamily protein